MPSERNTRIRAGQIRSIYPDDIEATIALGTGMDNYVPSYDEATGKFTWIAMGSLASIADIGDVDFDTGTPGDNYILVYDDSTGVQKWKASNKLNCIEYNIPTKRITVSTFTAQGINDAIDALGVDGGEVYLPEGTYVCTDATITIDYNNTTLTGAGAGTILDWSAGQNGFLDTNDKTFVTIQNIYFLGSDVGGDTNAFIGDNDNADNLTVQNCWFYNSDYYGIYTSGKDVKIIGNWFSSNANYDVITNDIYLLLHNNNFDTTYGIYIYSRYSVISNNTFNNTTSVRSGGGFTTISGNTFFTTRGLDVRTGNYDTVIGNIFYETVAGQKDIFIYQNDYTSVIGNICIGRPGTSDKGIWLDDSDYCILKGNITNGHLTSGIQEDSDCVGNLISGNNCKDTVPYIINGINHENFVTKSSIQLENNAIIANKVNTDIDAGTEIVDTFADTLGDAVVWHYVVVKGVNIRAGTITACWDYANDTVEYTETATNDIGDTSVITFSVDIDSNNVRLLATAGTGEVDWEVRIIRNLI